ncbi:MAG: chorismate synthase [Chlamydiia bacterium]|nr:chorismate synthase [Chlamydiia bacterium]
MGANAFGKLFRITTWGESHGKAIGVVIDGCPAGLPLTEEEIQMALDRRRPGQNGLVSPRQEMDHAEILSGVFQGQTTGAPISIMIPNKDADSKPYEKMKGLLKPGHAHYTYLEKYGIFDYRGGGRASARETACRVAAGAVAMKLLKQHEIAVWAYLYQVGDCICPECSLEDLEKSELFCVNAAFETSVREKLLQVKAEGDSVGGAVAFLTSHLPAGLGDPVYEKLEANLSKAMMSLPASKGFEVGRGFDAVKMCGSEHNDPFTTQDGMITMKKNCSGGTLGGISTGMPLYGRVAFKPTSSISKAQDTVSTDGKEATYQVEGRHDPCVAIRAVPMVEAMVALVLADALLYNRCVRL